MSAFTSLDGTSANTFTDLDNLNRTIGSTWTKDLSTDRDFYSVSIAYDRNSNITSIVDNVLKAGVSGNRHYDVKYTMDGLNRVTQADEGTFSGSISNRSRQENWILDQLGNWELNQVDLDGDVNFNEAGELNDDRTHNIVNELTARDTDDNGTNNFTLTYDAVGNMTSQNGQRRYIYDVWGRLRRIESTVSFPRPVLAEYRYNGLGHRIRAQKDTKAA